MINFDSTKLSHIHVQGDPAVYLDAKSVLHAFGKTYYHTVQALMRNVGTLPTVHGKPIGKRSRENDYSVISDDHTLKLFSDAVFTPLGFTKSSDLCELLAPFLSTDRETVVHQPPLTNMESRMDKLEQEVDGLKAAAQCFWNFVAWVARNQDQDLAPPYALIEQARIGYRVEMERIAGAPDHFDEDLAIAMDPNADVEVLQGDEMDDDEEDYEEDDKEGMAEFIENGEEGVRRLLGVGTAGNPLRNHAMLKDVLRDEGVLTQDEIDRVDVEAPDVPDDLFKRAHERLLAAKLNKNTSFF